MFFSLVWYYFFWCYIKLGSIVERDNKIFIIVSVLLLNNRLLFLSEIVIGVFFFDFLEIIYYKVVKWRINIYVNLSF